MRRYKNKIAWVYTMGSTSRHNPNFPLKITTTKEIIVMICHMNTLVRTVNPLTLG